MLDYEELRVRARRVGPDRFLLLANGPSAAATVVTVAGDVPARLRAEFDELINIELNLAPSAGTDVGERLRELGRTLFGMLFPGPIAECLKPRPGRALGERKPLRVRFDLPPALQDLPVEALVAPTGIQTLVLDSRWSVVRSIAGETPNLPSADEDRAVIELLVAVASPKGSEPLSAGDDIRRLAKLPKRTVRTTVEFHATRRRIEDWLAEHAGRPSAILLIAHGEYGPSGKMGTVYLEAEDGGRDPVPAELLSGILNRGRKLRLVVLNLCSGAVTRAAEPYSGLAQALIGRGIPAVIGMRADITNSAAALFGPRVLAGVAGNETVDEAVVSARHEIHTIPGYTAIEWATPALFLHESCGHGWLLKAPVVLEDSEVDEDPLRDGQAAYDKVREAPQVKSADLIPAAAHLRIRRDWNGIVDLLDIPKKNADLAALFAEAELELAWPEIDELCAVLATGREGDKADEILSVAKAHLPGPVAECLCAEVARSRTDATHAATEKDRRAQEARATDQATASAEAEPGSGYTRLQAAVEDEDWSGVLALASSLDGSHGHPKVRTLTHYAAGRLAENAEEWNEAADFYNRCHAYADAGLRGQYVCARRLESEGHWQAAIEFYASIPQSRFNDAADRGRRLEALLAMLPLVGRAAGVPLVPDPLLDRDPAFPYRVLRAVRITPGSSTAEVRDAAFMLMPLGLLNDKTRRGWDALRDPAKRLVLDALSLHGVRDPRALIDALHAAETPGAARTATDVDLAADAPLLALLRGDRDGARDGWRRRLADDPVDMAAAHSLAIVSLADACQLENAGSGQEAASLWHDVIATWVALLNGQTYWSAWEKERASCYGHPVTSQDTVTLRPSLSQHLHDVLSGYAEKHAVADRPAQAAAYRELLQLLEAELDAARVLRDADGLPLGSPDSRTLVCGPMYLRMAGLTERFAAFVAATEDAADDPDAVRRRFRRVRWAFSESRRAFSSAEHYRYASALQEMGELLLHRKNAPSLDCAGPTAQEHGSVAACPMCHGFLNRDPAYAYLPDRSARLLQDAVELSVRVNLFVARDLLARSGHEADALSRIAEVLTASDRGLMSARAGEAAIR
ncbi:MAG: CHAT domain-containing protein, partial [Catenulispora sp.]